MSLEQKIVSRGYFSSSNDIFTDSHTDSVLYMFYPDHTMHYDLSFFHGFVSVCLYMCESVCGCGACVNYLSIQFLNISSVDLLVIISLFRFIKLVKFL